MSPDIKLAVAFAVYGVFAIGTMVLLAWVLPKVRERGQEVCQRCDGCEDVQGGLCAECFENAPMGVWF